MIETRDRDLINNVISSFTRENEALVDQLIQIQYWMRGAISRDDVWALSPIERDKIIEFLNKRFKEAGDLTSKQVPQFL